MRMCGWSSDVCSSDLARSIEAADPGMGRAGPARRPLFRGARAFDGRFSGVRLPGGKFSVRDTGSYARVAKSVLQNGALEPLSIHVRKRPQRAAPAHRSEENTSELQSLMRISYAV